MSHDIKRAFHLLIHRPGFSILVILTLGLGIGATSTIFSVVNRALLNPISLPEPQRLVVLEETHPETSSHWGFVSPQNFRDWRERNQSFEAMAAYQWVTTTLSGDGAPIQLETMRVSDAFFRVMGTDLELGRGFSSIEDQPGGPPVVVLSNVFWKRRFGGNPEILGQSLILDRKPHTVVGVAPEELLLPGSLDIWLPLSLDYDSWPRDFRWAGVYGRLESNVTLDEAQADMARVAAQLEEEYPATNAGWTVTLETLTTRMTGIAKPAMLLLLAAAAMVLAIAMTNVAALLLSSGAARRGEVAVRQALGASRVRLVRQFLTESLILAALGGGLGLMMTLWSSDLVNAFFANHFPQAAAADVKWSLVGFTGIVSIAVGLLAGVIPALQVSRRGPANELRRSTTSPMSSARARSTLLVFEVAVALVLLVGASLLTRSFLTLLDVDPGFTSENILSAALELPESDYGDGAKMTLFFEDLLQRVENLPAVASAGIINPMPLANIGVPLQFRIEGYAASESDERQETLTRIVNGNYFPTMQIPIVQGRVIRESDNATAQRVIVVNETFAQRFFPEGDAMGKRVAFGPATRGPEPTWHTIIGVVGDVRHTGLDREAGPEAYFSVWQEPFRYVTLVVRTDADPSSTVEMLRQSVNAIDPYLPLSNVQTVEEIVRSSLGRREFTLTLLGIFAALALTLAGIGIYGVVRHAVNLRVREVGIRMALGATRGEVLKMALRQMLAPVYVGVAFGLSAALGLGRLLESQVYGVNTKDPFTLIGVSMMILAVALAASVLPIRRATRIEPMVVLREE